MIQFLSQAPVSKLKGVAVVRLDFNTEDTWRLEATLPTVRHLLKHARAIVILSHRGRPSAFKLKGSVPEGPDAEKFSQKGDAATLGEFLRRDVIFLPEFRFGEIRAAVASAPRGSLFLLENVRFLAGEIENSAQLGKEFASLGDYYVNDAFAVDHRANASLVAVTRYLPSYAGFQLEKEMRSLGGVIRGAKKPFLVVVGGAKAHDKLEVLRNLRRSADAFLLGGAPANTMLVLRGIPVGDSLADDEPEDIRLLAPFAKSNKVIVPVDWCEQNKRILDIGPKTAAEYAGILARARTILWAGPMGLIEDPKFAQGNLAVARAIARNRKAFSVTGGGETVMFLKKYKLDKKFSFISTGGGAMLEFLAGEKLPGIEALKKESRI